MKQLFIFAAIALFRLFAWAGNYTTDNVERIKSGMTEAEVIAVLGEPVTKTTRSDGIASWEWSKISLEKVSLAVVEFKDAKVFHVPGELLKEGTIAEYQKLVRDRYLKNHPDLSDNLKYKLGLGHSGLDEIEQERRREVSAKKAQQELRTTIDQALTNPERPAQEKFQESLRVAEVEAWKKEIAEVNKKRDEEAKLKWEAEQKRQAEERRQRTEYIAARKTVEPRIAQCITDQKICLGMNEKDVELSWGKPLKINSIVEAAGSRVRWTYSGNIRVNFEDGKVTSWETSE